MLTNDLRERAASYRLGGPSSEHTAKMLEEAASTIEILTEALERIERWFGEFPETGKFWDNTDGTKSDRPMSYAACYGSNGERDYMRSVARAALSLAKSETPQ